MPKVHRLIPKFRGLCAYCGQSVRVSTLRDSSHATVDHAVPKARGGTNADDNVLLCCLRCNGAKADMTADEFRHFLSTGKIADAYIEYLTERLRLKMAGRAQIVVHTDFAFPAKISESGKPRMIR